MTWALLLLGLVILIKGADIFVKGASALATLFKVSPLVIGLTVVAFGTSAPEAAVSIFASIQRVNGIAFGNVIGSNLFNILVILGISAMILPIKAPKGVLRKELPFALASSLVLLLFYFTGSIGISRLEGVILLILFGLFLWLVFIKRDKEAIIETPEDSTMPKTKAIMYTIGGIIAVMIGGTFVSTYASALAIFYGMSEMFVGLTIVALGTSAPELTTSIVALIKKEGDLALGNIIGSNIFNTLFVLGIASVITPITDITNVVADVILGVVATIIVFYFTFTKKTLSRVEGIILFLLYCIYIAYIILRG